MSSFYLCYLARGNGKVVNQTEWIDTIHRGEQDLGFDCVTIMLEKLDLDMSARRVAGNNDVVKVKLQSPIKSGCMELVLEVLPGPLEDLHDPVRLVIVGGVSENPGLDNNNAMGYKTGKMKNMMKDMVPL